MHRLQDRSREERTDRFLDLPALPTLRVAVGRPIHTTFDYAVPEHLCRWAVPGARCLVPFGRGQCVGFVLSAGECGVARPVKELIEVLDREPAISEDLLRLGLWIARYYHHPVGEVLFSLLPPAFRTEIRAVYRAVGDVPVTEGGSAEARLWEVASKSGGLRSTSVAPSDLIAFRRLLLSGLLERDWATTPQRRAAADAWYVLDPSAPTADSVAKRSPRVAEVLRVLGEGPGGAEALLSRGVSRDALARATEKGWIHRGGAQVPSPQGGVAALWDEQKVEVLTPEQSAAVHSIGAALEKGEFCPFLVHGVTGSGKTEVYLRSVAEARRLGRGAVVLVPEISLTPQFLGRFVAHFGDDVAVLHSGLSGGERREQWDRVKTGRASIALGARSAVFAPVKSLGIIVVDEEHEASYKQEEGLRYHAKHVALQRARFAGAVVVLGSATPDVETCWAVANGRYRALYLSQRAQAGEGPVVELVDLRQEERRRRQRVLLSERLRACIDGALARGEQVLLFLNRRGFSPALVCSSCGEAVHCPHCSVALTLHGRQAEGEGHLVCHYCSIQRSRVEVCPGCGSPELHPSGAGTQRLFEAVRLAWPAARVVRLDRDALQHGSGAELLGTFHRGDADILIGTQMVAKGHHFPRLSVVGVVDADLSLNFPDFRAAERTFQVLVQVAGRAGRAALPGTVVLQTRNPCHPVLKAVQGNAFEAFADEELNQRRDAGFPPFRRLALVGISSPDGSEARRAAGTVAQSARDQGRTLGVEVLGPSPAPLERVRGRYRFQVLLKAPGPQAAPVQEVLRRLRSGRCLAFPGGVRVFVDIDPVSLL